MRILTGELKTKINETVTVAGWVNSRRDHGGLIFIDLRDHQGIIQLVITPENQQAFALAETLRDEFVISATGLIRERAADLKNPHIETGDIELVVESMELLNRSDTPQSIPTMMVQNPARSFVSSIVILTSVVQVCKTL